MTAKGRNGVQKGDVSTEMQGQESIVSANNPLDANLPFNVSLLARNLLFFVALKTIGSFDSGACSAALGSENGITEEWGLSTVQQGTLSSSVFLGNIVGCPLSGHLFTHYSAKKVLLWSLVLHTFFTFLFATLTNYSLILLCRFFIGVTLSFVIVYTPLWVDIFAPPDRQSIWMASHNAGVPVGIMLGYICGAFLPTYTNVNWEWTFYIKCIITIPPLAYLMRVDSRSIDRPNKSRLVDATPTLAATNLQENMSAAERVFNVLHSNVVVIWSSCVPLTRNLEFMCSMLAMCSLYFVVTGLQNFVTQYLRDEPFNASMKTIMLGFGFAVVTAPVLGVVVGGILLDRMGGYKKNLRCAATFITAWGVAGAFFSVMCTFLNTTMSFLFVISIVLFCGGAIISPASGTVVASVPERLRPAAAALSQMMYNLLGNFSGPLVCGYVAQWTGHLKYGIYTVLCCSVVGLIPTLVLLRKVWSTPDVSSFAMSVRQQFSRQTGIHEECIVSGEMNNVIVEAAGMEKESPRCSLEDDDWALQVDGDRFTHSTTSSAASPATTMNATAVTIPPRTLLPQTTQTTANVVVPGNKKKPSHSVRLVAPPTATSTTTRASSITGMRNSVDSLREEIQRRSSRNSFLQSRQEADATSNDTVHIDDHMANSGELVAVLTPAEFGLSAGQTNEKKQQDKFDLMVEADAAQMMSLPNQHSFGLDILRSLLGSTSHRLSSSRGNSPFPTVSSTGHAEEADVDIPIDIPRGLSERNEVSRSHTPVPLMGMSSELSHQQ